MSHEQKLSIIAEQHEKLVDELAGLEAALASLKAVAVAKMAAAKASCQQQPA